MKFSDPHDTDIATRNYIIMGLLYTIVKRRKPSYLLSSASTIHYRGGSIE